jgi:hypothetical protein
MDEATHSGRLRHVKRTVLRDYGGGLISYGPTISESPLGIGRICTLYLAERYAESHGEPLTIVTEKNSPQAVLGGKPTDQKGEL